MVSHTLSFGIRTAERHRRMSETTIVVNVGRRILVTANDRFHWREKARRTKILRTLGCEESKNSSSLTPPVSLTATIAYPRRVRRRDAANLAPTIKAILDGIVDAGILPDDNDHVITATTYVADSETNRDGIWTILLTFIECQK